MKTIGIVGSRRRNTLNDESLVKDKFFEIYQEGDQIVSGGCWAGGDKFAENIARDNDIDIIIHKADWARHGRIAGFLRNTTIAEDCDVLIACVSEDRTGGTEDTIKKAVKLGKKIILV